MPASSRLRESRMSTCTWTNASGRVTGKGVGRLALVKFPPLMTVERIRDSDYRVAGAGACCLTGCVGCFERDFLVVERPLTHVTDTRRTNAVENQIRVVWATEVLAEQRVGVPDLLEKDPVGHDFSD